MAGATRAIHWIPACATGGQTTCTLSSALQSPRNQGEGPATARRTTLAFELGLRYLLVLGVLCCASATFQYIALRHFLVATASRQLAAAVRQPVADYHKAIAAGVSAAAAAQTLVRAVADPSTMAWVILPSGAVMAESAGPHAPPVPHGLEREAPAPARPTAAGTGPPPIIRPRGATRQVAGDAGPPPARPPSPTPEATRIASSDVALETPLGSPGVGKPGRVGTAAGAPEPETLIVATPVRRVLAVLGSELRLLILGGLAVLAIGGASGALAVRAALSPLRRITAVADRIAAGDMSPRSAAAGDPRDVAHLAIAFDSMVDRLTTAVIEERATHQQMRRFLDDASHELRTPTAALAGMLEVLQGEAGQNPKALRSGMRAAYRQARRLGALVSSLLALARADRPAGLPLEATDLGVILEAVRPAAERLAADHRIDWRPPSTPCPLLANAEALGSAVLDLIDNAVRYSPSGTTVRLVAVPADDAVHLSITDHGPGIAGEHLPHLFERFYRCPPAPGVTAPTGTGLGLAFVRSVVERHHGTVAMESRLGDGTTVRIALPLCPTTHGEAPEKRASTLL